VHQQIISEGNETSKDFLTQTNDEPVFNEFAFDQSELCISSDSLKDISEMKVGSTDLAAPHATSRGEPVLNLHPLTSEILQKS